MTFTQGPQAVSAGRPRRGYEARAKFLGHQLRRGGYLRSPITSATLHWRPYRAGETLRRLYPFLPFAGPP